MTVGIYSERLIPLNLRWAASRPALFKSVSTMGGTISTNFDRCVFKLLPQHERIGMNRGLGCAVDRRIEHRHEPKP